MSTDMVMNNTKILECEMASPESEVFCGKEWMTDLEKAKLNVEEQDAYNQAFKQKPGTLAGKEIKGGRRRPVGKLQPLQYRG